ncbi:MAG: hydrogenase maturation protease [Methanomassiliicoccales archaeon]
MNQMTTEKGRQRILVLGLGSPIISDDSIGLRIADEIRSHRFDNVEIRDASTSGLDLIELMLDFDYVIVVDGIITGISNPGSVFVFDEQNFSTTVRGANPHDVNIATAIRLGRMIEPERMPKKIFFVAIEVVNTKTVGENLTPEVEASIPKAVEAVLDLIYKTRCDANY